MNFEEIGKLYTTKNRIYNLYMCVGYDFLEEKYILASLDSFFNHRQLNYLNSSYEETTFEKIIDNFNKELKKYEKIVELKEFVTKKTRNTKEKNYQEELSNIINKYFEIKNSIESTKSLMQWSFVKNNEENRVFYEKQIKIYEKGMKRLEKRFYFFFGNESKNLLNTLSSLSRNQYYQAVYKCDSIKKQKENFLNQYNELIKKIKK